MSVLYVGYLLFALGGIMALSSVYRVSLRAKTGIILRAILPIVFVFTAWDIFAVARGHWSFGLENTLGWVIFNQPIEEIAFFVVIPLFGIVLWEILGERA